MKNLNMEKNMKKIIILFSLLILFGCFWTKGYRSYNSA